MFMVSLLTWERLGAYDIMKEKNQEWSDCKYCAHVQIRGLRKGYGYYNESAFG